MVIALLLIYVVMYSVFKYILKYLSIHLKMPCVKRYLNYDMCC